MSTLWEQIGDAQPGDTITLSPGIYDHADVLRVRKDLSIKGPREAIIRAEFAVTNGAQFNGEGFTIEHNKPGAPQKTGVVIPYYPQNAHFVVLNAALWLDDIDMYCTPTGHAHKRAIEARHANVSIRTMTKYSRIDWRYSREKVVTLYDGSYLQAFGKTNQLTLGVCSGTEAAAGAALEIVGSKAILSGSHWFGLGTTPYGAAVARDSFLQVGAGLQTTLQFVTPSILDATGSRKWVDVQGGCIG